MIVAIHAYESNYEGLYGICYDGIEKVETKDKARKIASMYAENVCFESTDVCRIFQENAIRAGLKENTEEYHNFIYTSIASNIRYEIYEVKPYNTIENMEIDYLCNSELFIKEHCTRQL